MGVTKVFAENDAEFTKLTADIPVYLTGANQSVRVEIDEEGVKAAVYMELPLAGSAEPPEEIIDFYSHCTNKVYNCKQIHNNTNKSKNIFFHFFSLPILIFSLLLYHTKNYLKIIFIKL